MSLGIIIIIIIIIIFRLQVFYGITELRLTVQS